MKFKFFRAVWPPPPASCPIACQCCHPHAGKFQPLQTLCKYSRPSCVCLCALPTLLSLLSHLACLNRSNLDTEAEDSWVPSTHWQSRLIPSKELADVLSVSGYLVCPAVDNDDFSRSLQRVWATLSVLPQASLWQKAAQAQAAFRSFVLFNWFY